MLEWKFTLIQYNRNAYFMKRIMHWEIQFRKKMSLHCFLFLLLQFGFQTMLIAIINRPYIVECSKCWSEVSTPENCPDTELIENSMSVCCVNANIFNTINTLYIMLHNYYYPCFLSLFWSFMWPDHEKVQCKVCMGKKQLLICGHD